MTGPARRAAARARGFTLVELMIAMAITAVIGAAIAGAFARIDKAGDVARLQGERYASARLALTRMAREISMAYVSDHFDTTQYRERPTLFRGREDDLLFTTMAHERLWRDAKESDESLVEYQVDRDPDHPGEDALLRREKAHIDDDAERGGRKDVVCERVARLDLRYWDRKRNEWVREWSTRAVDHAADLPTRVRIELELRMPSGGTEKFTTEARLAVTRPLDF